MAESFTGRSERNIRPFILKGTDKVFSCDNNDGSNRNYGANIYVFFSFCSCVRELQPPSTTVTQACVDSELDIQLAGTSITKDARFCFLTLIELRRSVHNRHAKKINNCSLQTAARWSEGPISWPAVVMVPAIKNHWARGWTWENRLHHQCEVSHRWAGLEQGHLKDTVFIASGQNWAG